jgi:hypothetical protein
MKEAFFLCPVGLFVLCCSAKSHGLLCFYHFNYKQRLKTRMERKTMVANYEANNDTIPIFFINYLVLTNSKCCFLLFSWC